MIKYLSSRAAFEASTRVKQAFFWCVDVCMILIFIHDFHLVYDRMSTLKELAGFNSPSCVGSQIHMQVHITQI